MPRVKGVKIPTNKVSLVKGSEITPLSPKNDQQLLPHGMKKLKFNSKTHVGSISITRDSGLVFSYTGETFTPEHGDYLLADEATVRCEIEEVDSVNKKITLSDGEDCGCDSGLDLTNGTYTISRPYEYYIKIPNIEDNTFLRELAPGFSLPACCFYGYTASRIKNAFEDDFLEMGIVCKDGVPIDAENWAIPPFGWTVDYDYCWVDTLAVQPTVTCHLADGAPGYLPSGFHMRIKYYPTEISAVDRWISAKFDIIFAKKDG